MRRFAPTAAAALVLAAAALVAGGGCGSTGAVTLQPGESLNAAAKRAGKDGIVHIPSGTWPAQTVNTGTTGDCATQAANPSQTRDCRTFLVDPGSKVSLGNLRIEGAGTAILATRGDLRIAGVYSLNGASESMVSGAIIDPANGDPGVYLDHVTRFQLRNSEVTGVLDNDGVDVYGGPTGSRDTLIQDNWIHGVRISPNSCQHTDGVQVAGTSGPGNTGTIIRGNTIEDVDQNAAIQLDSASGQVGTDESVVDNTLGPVNYTPTSCVPSPNPRSINVSGRNFYMAGNVLRLKAFVYPGTGTVTGNRGVGTSGACSAYKWSGNTWTQGGC